MHYYNITLTFHHSVYPMHLASYCVLGPSHLLIYYGTLTKSIELISILNIILTVRRLDYPMHPVLWFRCTCNAPLGKKEGLAGKSVNHIGWMTVVTPPYRPKSARNHRVIEVFGGVFVLSFCLFEHLCWYRDFCHRTESNLFIFLQIHEFTLTVHVLCSEKNPLGAYTY